MEFVIGIILLIIVLVIVMLIIRKRLYGSVDYYEEWKLKVMNRNIASELSRLKSLNLKGYTKGKFEHWKEKWDDILSNDLADVEELLYDAEHAIDQFRFSRARKILTQIDQTLEKLEQEIDLILQELEELLETERSTRAEEEKIRPLIAELRKQLSQNRYKFGRAENRLELEFDTLDEALHTYQQAIDEGNYEEAKTITKNVIKRAQELQHELDELPQLYSRCNNELPAKLDDIYKGFKEMQNKGFHVQHLNFEKEINDYQSRLIDCVTLLEREGMADVVEMVDEIDEHVADMFEQLEKEALAKNYVESKLPNYQHLLENFYSTFTETKSEVETLKLTYFFEDSDLEKYMNIEKMIEQLKKQVTTFVTRLTENQSAHSELRDELEQGFQQLENISEEHDLFKKRIQNLRKDELEAREQLEEMNESIYKTHRLIRNSNLPGIPNYIWILLEEAKSKNDRVLDTLEEKPLDIIEVQKTLTEAKSAIDQATENTNVMIEQAQLTEHVIQYANRYRSSYPILAAQLMESERLFRASEYELALEKAAEAIEEIEPGALKRIEKYQEVVVS